MESISLQARAAATYTTTNLLSTQGMPVAKIAEVTFTSADRVRDVIHNFNADGFEALYPTYNGGRPRTFTLPERREIKKIAKSKPAEQGLPSDEDYNAAAAVLTADQISAIAWLATVMSAFNRVAITSRYPSATDLNNDTGGDTGCRSLHPRAGDGGISRAACASCPAHTGAEASDGVRARGTARGARSKSASARLQAVLKLDPKAGQHTNPAYRTEW
jgi:transposase